MPTADIALPLRLVLVNDGAYRLESATGVVVGQIKRIGGTWKFKALWLDEVGDWVPGGGPLTDRHNTVLNNTDVQRWQSVLMTPTVSK